MLVKLGWRTRGADARSYPENKELAEFDLTSLGEGIVTPGLGLYTELGRMGETWQYSSGNTTGSDATPTTAGTAGLWNGEPAGGRSLVIDSVVLTCFEADAIAPSDETVWAQIVRPPAAAPADAGLAIRSLNGKRGYGGRARTVAAPATISGRWFTIGGAQPDAPALAGTAWSQSDIPVLGLFVIPPGGMFALALAKTNASGNNFFTVRWHEIQLPVVT